MDASRFDVEALAPGAFDDPAARGVLGVGLASPRADAVHESGASSEVDTALGASPWRRRMAPRHRRAVRTLLGPDATTNTTPTRDASGGEGTKREDERR